MRAKKFITKALHVVIVMICLATESTPNEQPPHAQSTTSSDLSKDLESGDIPFDKRIESMMFLTNGLILTEAIASKKLDMNRVITDFMIIGQLDDLVDWFEVLSSAEVDDETVKNIESLFNQLAELHQVIENGFQSKINTEVLKTAVLTMNRIEVINEVIADARSYQQLLKKSTKIKGFDSVLESLVRLPDAMRAFEKVSDRPGSLDHVKTGIQLIEIVKEENKAKHWKTFIRSCEALDTKLQLETCGTSLRAAMTDLKIPVGANLSLLLDAIAVVDMLGMETSEAKWEKLKGLVNDLKSITEQLEFIEKFRASKKQAFTNIRNFRSLMTDIKNLSTSSNELQSLTIALTALEPIQKIVEKLKNTYRSTSSSNSRDSSSYFISSLKSYEGLPNGMKSIEALLERVGPSHGIPTQILKSKIFQRIEIMKGWITNISPMIGSRDAFKNIPRLSKFMYILMNTTTTEKTHDLTALSNTVEKYYNETQSTGNILITIKSLCEMITSFNLEDWKTNFVEIVKSYTVDVEKDDFKKLSSALRILPGFIEFNSKMKTLLTFEPNDDLYGGKVVSFIRNHSHEIKGGIKNAENLLSVIKTATFTDSDIVIVQKKLKSTPRQIKLKLETHNYTFDVIQNELFESEKFFLNENNKPTIESFVSTSSDLLNSIIPNYDGTNAASMVMEKDDIDAVENLIKALVASRFKATVIEQSDAISKMMTNTPSGYHLLNSIRPGAMSYQKFADGYSAFMNIEGMSRRKRNAKTSTLLDALRNIFEKIKPITQINNNDASVFGILRDFPSFISPLKQFATDVKKISSDDQMEAQKSLEALKATGTTSDMMNIELEQIRQSLKVLGTKFSDQIFELIGGLQKMYSILEFVDCQKTPNDPVCSIKGNTYWSTVVPKKSFRDMVIISVVVVGVCAIVGGVIYWLNKKLKKKRRYRNATNLKDIEANHKRELLLKERELDEQKALLKKKNKKKDQYALEIKWRDEKIDEMKQKEKDNKKLRDDADQLRADYEKAKEEKTKSKKDIKSMQKRVDAANAAVLKEFRQSIDITTCTKDEIYCGFLYRRDDFCEEQKTLYKEYWYNQFKNMMIPVEKQFAEFDESLMRVNTKLFKTNCVTLRGDTDGQRVHANKICDMPGITYYASQAPRSHEAKKESNAAFYEMLFEKSIKNVVQLCSDKEGDQEVINYTSTGTYGDYVVSRVKLVKVCHGVDGAEYKVVNKKMGTERVFTHVQFADWEEGGAPSDPSIYVDCIKWLIKNAGGAVLVHCQDGGERTMAFSIIAHILLYKEKFTTEIENITLQSAIEHLKNERYGFVLSPLLIAFIELALHYCYIAECDDYDVKMAYSAHLELYKACRDDINTKYKEFMRKHEENSIII